MRSTQGWWVTPSTVKAVVLRGEEVLLCHNPRGEWELPGGRPDEGETSVAQVAVREVREETGLDVVAGDVVLADLFEVVPGHHLMLVAVTARVPDGGAAVTPGTPTSSHEHLDVRWFRLDALPANLPPLYAEAIARAVARGAGPHAAG